MSDEGVFSLAFVSLVTALGLGIRTLAHIFI